MKWLGKVVLKLLCWAVVLALVTIGLSRALYVRQTDPPYNTSEKINGFYAMEPDTLDVVFLGTSTTYFGFNPSVLWREYGIPSYIFANSEQPVFLSYIYAKEAIRTQHPRVLMLDAHTLQYTYDYARTAINHISLDDMPMSMNKLEAIFRYTPKEEWIEHLFSIVKYHTEGPVDITRRAQDPYLGYTPRFDGSNSANYNIGKTERLGSSPMGKREEEALRELIALCQKEGVQLVLINAPSDLYQVAHERMNYGAGILAEAGVPFFNMDTESWVKENNYQTQYDLAMGQIGHCNARGATKMTRAIGDYLTSVLGLTDHRDNPAYADWNAKTLPYYEIYGEKTDGTDDDFFLPQTNDLDMQRHLKRYLDKLKTYKAKGYAIMMSAYDEASTTADEEVDALLAELGWQYPISQDYRAGHVFVCVDGKVLASKMDMANAIYFAYENPEQQTRLSVWGEGFGAAIPKAGEGDLSAVENVDDVRCKIVINDQSFAISRGLNVVVYDTAKREVVDWAVFDLHVRQGRSASAKDAA